MYLALKEHNMEPNKMGAKNQFGFKWGTEKNSTWAFLPILPHTEGQYTPEQTALLWMRLSWPCRERFALLHQTWQNERVQYNHYQKVQSLDQWNWALLTMLFVDLDPMWINVPASLSENLWSEKCSLTLSGNCGIWERIVIWFSCFTKIVH